MVKAQNDVYLTVFIQIFRPDDLWESSEDIITDISVWSVGVKKNIFTFVLDR